MLLVAALAGFGGGNFASSMANITFFYPAREKGWALGLNAAGGNLGAAVAQLVVPIVITILAAGTVNLPLAGLIWIPLILLAMFGACKYMDNLTSAKADVAGSVAALKEPHLWIMALLYIGTFGSFIGFAGVFPKLIKDHFPAFSSIARRRRGPLARLPRRAGRLAGPSLRRTHGRPDGRRPDDRDRVRRDGRHHLDHDLDPAAEELLALPGPVPGALHRQRRRQRRHLPHDPGHLRHLQPGSAQRRQHGQHRSAWPPRPSA